MSTANFITKEELQNYDYDRVEDSYIPQPREKPLILPLIWLKTIFLAVFILVLVILAFALDLKFNIDAVYYTRNNWSKQMIVGFKPTDNSVQGSVTQGGETTSEKIFGYEYPGFRTGCDCRDPNKSMD